MATRRVNTGRAPSYDRPALQSELVALLRVTELSVRNLMALYDGDYSEGQVRRELARLVAAGELATERHYVEHVCGSGSAKVLTTFYRAKERGD